MHSHDRMDQMRAVQSHEVEISRGSLSTTPGGGKRGAADEREGDGEWVEPELPGRTPLVRRLVGEAVPNGRLPPPLPKSAIVGVVVDSESLVVAPKDGGFGIERDSGLFGRRPAPLLPPTGDDAPDDGTLKDSPGLVTEPAAAATRKPGPGEPAANWTA